MFQPGPGDRMQVRGTGSLQHPASCAVCGAGRHDDGFLDLGVYFDYEGNVYLCMTCAYQAAETVGCLIPNEANQLRELSESLAETNKGLRIELGILHERLKVFNAALSGLASTNAGSAGLSGNSNGEDAVATDEAVAEAGTESSEGEPEVTEPVPSSGRAKPRGVKQRDSGGLAGLLD